MATHNQYRALFGHVQLMTSLKSALVLLDECVANSVIGSEIQEKIQETHQTIAKLLGEQNDEYRNMLEKMIEEGEIK